MPWQFSSHGRIDCGRTRIDRTEGCDYDAGQPKGSGSHAGHVAFSKGKVMITRGDHAPTAIKAGDTLEKGNTVEVGNDGLAILALANGQRKTLKSKESYTIK